MASWKAHGDFLFAIIELFHYILHFRSYEAKCVQLSCFPRGSTSLHSNFTWSGLSLGNHSWHQKARDTGLPDGEDRIPLRSLVLTQYRSVTDRQTDGHTDKYAAAYTSVCKTSFAQRCNEISFDGFRFYTVSGKK